MQASSATPARINSSDGDPIPLEARSRPDFPFGVPYSRIREVVQSPGTTCVEAGEYRPVVDRTYSMTEVVDAHRYVEAWQKAGNVVLTLD
jgi:NADPH:quinone reductase-like Zn-dependent oxidoreductase